MASLPFTTSSLVPVHPDTRTVWNSSAATVAKYTAVPAGTPTIRFGTIGSAHAVVVDTVITAAAANGEDTDLTIGATDFSATGAAMPAGTAVYFATVAADEFHTVLVSGCTGTKLDVATGNDNIYHATNKIPDDTVVEIIPGDGVDCKGDTGEGTAPFGRLSTLTAYYGANAEAAKANDDGVGTDIAGCESECYEFGCDPATFRFGNPSKFLVGVLAEESGVSATTAFVTIEGGRGKYINGWPLTQQGGAWGKIRFGSPDADLAGFPTEITLNAAPTASGANTKLNFANVDFTGKNVPPGTKVYYALTGSDYYNDFFKNTCVKKFGSSRRYQDPDEDFRIVTIRAQKKGTGQEATVYIDGLHDGCESAAACTITAPMVFPADGDANGVTKQLLQALRVGLMTAAPAAGTASSTASAREAGALTNAYANVDIAEMLIYSAALSPEEMDRVGNYLSVKFNLPAFRLNSFIRSPTRSVAVSTHAGCDRVLNKPHQSAMCDGYPGCSTLDEDTLVLSKRLADSDTDDYYNGMRLYITGGGDATLSKTCGACVRANVPVFTGGVTRRASRSRPPARPPADVPFPLSFVVCVSACVCRWRECPGCRNSSLCGQQRRRWLRSHERCLQLLRPGQEVAVGRWPELRDHRLHCRHPHSHLRPDQRGQVWVHPVGRHARRGAHQKQAGGGRLSVHGPASAHGLLPRRVAHARALSV